MRVALVSYEFPPYIYGGIGNYTRQTARMLGRRGHDVEVFAACPHRSHHEVVEGLPVHYGCCTDRWSFASVAKEMLERRHEVRPFDVVEAPELASEGRGIFQRFPHLASVVRLHTPAYLAAQVDWAAFGKGALLLQSLRQGCGEVARGRWPRKALRFWRHFTSLKAAYDPSSDEERSTALKADVIASPSQRLASDVERDWRLGSGVVRVVPYPHVPDPRLLSIAPGGGPVRTVCYFGGIKAYKGVDVLARAIPRVMARHPGMRFVFAGSSQVSPLRDFSPRAFVGGGICTWGDMEAWLKKRLAPLGDSVQFRGHLDPERLSGLLGEADLCVFPSRYDNFPNACLEAMAAARPIVATRSGGMEEMLEVAQAGSLVAPDDERDLARAICWMTEHPSERRVMALRARERVLGAYSDGVVGPLYEELYTSAVALRSGGRAPALRAEAA